MLTRLICVAAMIASLGFTTGCATGPHTAAAPGAKVKCIGCCTVCKCNADLACVEVKVDDKTPQCVYKGVTYYFCSDQCRKDFEKDPAKYSAYLTK